MIIVDQVCDVSQVSELRQVSNNFVLKRPTQIECFTYTCRQHIPYGISQCEVGLNQGKLCGLLSNKNIQQGNDNLLKCV